MFTGVPLSPDEPADGIYTVDELVERLREDPVLVQLSMGNGHRDEVDAQLTELAGRLDEPVHVALIEQPAGLNAEDPVGELTALLHAELGPGYYFVAVNGDHSGSGWTGYGEDLPTSYQVRAANPDPPLYDRQAPIQSTAGQFAEALATLDNDLEALPSETLQTYRESAVWSSPAPRPGGDDPVTAGTYGVAITTVGLSLVLGLLLVLRLVRSWRTGPPPTKARARSVGQRRLPGVPDAIEPSGPAVTRAALRELRHLERRRAQVHRRPVPLEPETLALADRSHETAQALLDGLPEDADQILPGSPELLDAVGAWVLVRIARQALDEPDGPPYQPCFLNPCHGHGEERTTIGVGAGDVTVPACRHCRDLDHARHYADPLMIRDWRGERPYYQGRSVWAETGFGALSEELWREVEAARSRR